MIVTVEEAIERSVYYKMLDRSIELGYSIDPRSYDLTTRDIDELKRIKLRIETDTQAIIDAKGFVVELFGASNNQSRGTKKVPRIVMETEAFMEGAIGMDPLGIIEKVEDGTYKKSETVSLVNDYYFKIHVVANTIEQLRILHYILSTSLPRRGYIKWYTEEKLLPSNNLLVTYLSTHELDWEQEGIMEKVYRYSITDVHVHEEMVTEWNIPPIKIIEIDIEGDTLLNKIITE